MHMLTYADMQQSCGDTAFLMCADVCVMYQQIAEIVYLVFLLPLNQKDCEQPCRTVFHNLFLVHNLVNNLEGDGCSV